MDIFWSKKGTVQQIALPHLENNLHRMFKEHDKLWIDMPEFTSTEENLLRSFFGIHPLTIEDCSKVSSRPKIEEFDTYLYIVLYGLDSHGDFMQCNFILGEDYLITIQRGRVESYEVLKHDAKLSRLLARDSEFVMHQVMDVETDKFFPIIADLDEQIQAIEAEVLLDTSTNFANKIFTLKHQLLVLKHHLAPQKEVLAQVSRRGNKFMTPSTTDYFRDIFDHVSRIIDNIDNYREILTSILDVHLSVMSNRMNDIIKVLTVVSTIFMPLTLIASIYGMNFRNMPELEWHYGYFIALAIMVAIGAWMYVYFKRKKWM